LNGPSGPALITLWAPNAFGDLQTIGDVPALSMHQQTNVFLPAHIDHRVRSASVIFVDFGRLIGPTDPGMNSPQVQTDVLNIDHRERHQIRWLAPGALLTLGKPLGR